MPQFHLLKIRLLLAVTLLFSVQVGDAIASDISLGKSVPAVARERFNFRPMTDEEKSSAMCVLGATTGMAASYIVGPSEVIMLVVGGVVVPSSSSILFWGLFGTIAAAGCTIGELTTPATSWLYNRFIGSN
jgi:dolichol kinase